MAAAQTARSQVPAFQVIQVAAAVRANPATVRNYLNGYEVRGSVGYAIAEECARRKLPRIDPATRSKPPRR